MVCVCVCVYVCVCTCMHVCVRPYFNMVIQCWRDICVASYLGLGVKLLYKCGGNLVGERTRAPKSSLVIELCFAADAVLTASTIGKTSLKPPWF